MRLADFRGKRNVLLVFHPFAWTGVCKEEALDLQANLEHVSRCRDGRGVRLVRHLGSPSGLEEKLGTTYTFASDFWQHGAAARAYGVFNEDDAARRCGARF